MNASPTERTPGAGRHVYLSAGNASASARNFACSVSRSIRKRFLTSSAASRLGTTWAATRVADPASAIDATIALRHTARRETMGNDKGRMACSSQLGSVLRIVYVAET